MLTNITTIMFCLWNLAAANHRTPLLHRQWRNCQWSDCALLTWETHSIQWHAHRGVTTRSVCAEYNNKPFKLMWPIQRVSHPSAHSPSEWLRCCGEEEKERATFYRKRAETHRRIPSRDCWHPPETARAHLERTGPLKDVIIFLFCLRQVSLFYRWVSVCFISECL